MYGEVLQEGCSREEAYGKFFPVTASLYGEFLRAALKEKISMRKKLLISETRRAVS